MKTIHLSRTDTYDSGLRALRRSGFYEKGTLDEAEDEFDSVSLHVVASIDGQPVASVRLTAHPLSPLKAWNHPVERLPSGDGVFEICRASVDSSHRGMGLYKLIMTEASLIACDLNATFVNAAIEPSFKLRGWLSEIGFHEIEGEILASNPPHGLMRMYQIVQEPLVWHTWICDVRRRLEQDLVTKGIEVVSARMEQIH